MKAGRTVLTIVWLSLVMLAALLICSRLGASGEAMFGTAAVLLGTFAATQAGKSGVEALATGQGLKGVAKSVMGEAKPPPPKGDGNG